MAAVLADPGRWALFIDIDGTLLAVAPTPDAVTVPAGLVPLLASVAQGLGGAAAVSFFLLKAVLPYQTEMREADYDPVGSVGRVSSTIRADGVGEVVYVRGGTRRSLGARAEGSRALERGTEVVITRFERGIAHVEPWAEFVAGDRPVSAVEKSE